MRNAFRLFKNNSNGYKLLYGYTAKVFYYLLIQTKSQQGPNLKKASPRSLGRELCVLIFHSFHYFPSIL